MRRPFARLATGCALAVATALFAGGALAGNGHGNQGHEKQQSSDQSQVKSNQSWPSQQSSTSGGSTDSSASSSDSTQAGVKPSNSTKHWTHTTVGAKPDVSKRYGNGKTAAEIAKSRGAPDSQPLTGPGNSQPHKTYDCKHKNNRSGGVDVHAIKSYDSSACQSSEQQKQGKSEEHKSKSEEHSKVEQKHESKSEEHVKVEVKSESDHKITLCHLTGSGKYVVITVDKHALKNGHTKEKGDIIPMPAGGCGSVQTQTQTEMMVTFCDMESATSGKLETKTASQVISHELNGTPEELRDIVPAFTVNGVTYSQNWDTNGQAIFNNHCQAVAAVAPTTTTTTNASTTTVLEQSTTTVASTATVTNSATNTVTNTQTVTVSNASASQNNSAAPSNTGGVLGAQTTLNKPKSNGGVLGTVGNVAGSTLPFTGFPVWLAVLIALALLLAGFALRRRSAAPRL